MINNQLHIPNIFEPDDQRRRQVLNTLLIFVIVTSLAAESLILLTHCKCIPGLPKVSGTEGAQMLEVFNPVNYYSMLMLFLVALISWTGMSIANRAAHDARRQAANFEVILNNIADGVLVLDHQGNFLSANPALLRMIPEDELMEIASKPFQKIIRWKHKVFAVTTLPVSEMGSVLIFRDQTRCHETEQARDALLATASHEFRTPLAAVMNYLEMLLMLTNMRKTDNEAFSAHLTRALENSRRLQHLIVNILDQAQIQAGVLELKQQRFNLPDLLEKSSQLLDISLKEKNLSYELSIAPDVPVEMIGDPERLNQVLANLIGNAIKFTNQGDIKVRVFMPMEEKLSIEVTDTGPGIPEEQLPDVFEAFRRASNYAHRQHQGAGLGLSITKEIVTHMGGEISVSSRLGVGSTFTVSLPLDNLIQHRSCN
jgi:signal transduction histidine kinase